METIIQVILFVIAAGWFAIGSMQFREKGPLLNNSYLFASAQERNTMEKKPLYRQSGTVCSLLGVIFLLIALGMLFGFVWLYGFALGAAVLTVLYAAVSSVKEVTNDRR